MRRMNMWQHAGILHVIMDRENITIMILMENIIMPMRMEPMRMEQAAGMLRIRSFVKVMVYSE